MIEINKGIGGPQFATQFLSGDHLARLSKQADKDSKGLLLQLDLYAVPAQLCCAQIDFEETKANRSRQIAVGHIQTPSDECSTAALSPCTPLDPDERIIKGALLE